MFNGLAKTINNRPKQGKISLYFAFLALTISAVSFLLFLEKYKEYTSEISIIFVPKSEMAAQDAERIIENMEILPTKMFFYDRMAAYDTGVWEKISNFSDINVEREKDSSVMKISASSKNREDSIMLTKTAAKTLFNIMGSYYDIKKDVDFRIVDGPTAHIAITNWISVLVSSLLTGILSILAMNLIFRNISNYPKKENKKNKFFEIFKKNKDASEIRKADEVYEIKAKPPVISKSPEKKSPAPVNLPSAPGELTFIDEDYFRNSIIKRVEPEPEIFEEIVEIEEPAEIAPEIEPSVSVPSYAEASENKKTPDDKEEPVDFHREPTQEELKKRLNQLLRGDL